MLSSERIVSIEPYKIGSRYFNREALRVSLLIMAGRCCIFLLDNLKHCVQNNPCFGYNGPTVTVTVFVAKIPPKRLHKFFYILFCLYSVDLRVS